MSQSDMSRKPRVFLSHSKKDEVFIERISNDLHMCQIETWLDKIEIRHGKSWLNQIFREGIPACDAIVVYLTEASLESVMVAKEIDASLIQQLTDKNVSFLPYVQDSSLRARLRSDLRSLQIPEWNDTNYSQLLPRVVSEIWRSYLERTVAQAVQEEKVLRLEAENEVQILKSKAKANVFGEDEEKDFSFIYSHFNRTISVTAVLKSKEGVTVKKAIHLTC